MFSPTDDSAGWVAAVLAFLSGGGLVYWKGYLRVRQDLRVDNTAETIYETYTKMIEELRSEVDRLNERVKSITQDLADEINARRKAEDRAVAAERKVVDLSSRVTTLELEIEHLKDIKNE